MNVVFDNRKESRPTNLFINKALGPVRQFLDDPNIVEISVNRPGEVFIERLGAHHMEFHSVPELTKDEIQLLAQQVAGFTNQFINDKNPILSASLPTGERIQFVLPPVATDGGSISIRKQVVSNFTLEDYRDKGSLDHIQLSSGETTELDLALSNHLQSRRFYDFLNEAIRNRVSILISGGTASGKTTFLNACLQAVHKEERIITLEDARELKPPQKNVVHLVASKGSQGTADVDMQKLLESSLRMRPDRLFVGEIRGAEAFTFLRGINTGHPGSMSTIHANTPDGAYQQLAMMVAQAGLSGGFSKAELMDYIRSVIPIVVQLHKKDGKRGISEIAFTKVSA
ncbi:P-type DNA transfer ATPase VirB11 (plasmid) [Agrobacterium tumefaciens]|uniref:P-type DNA transfer ATPase VirB11 n=1 Tax=Agrobacterium tumefaciens TaxID=358 RepID=UPI000472FB65|nr:P-type DNA transfer ATPase VirB11 [Agrobacterium tumefaciens]WCA73058.1 P-type DNA transfer ATPase VirB11 [Agrobacterium tumefaciens]